MRLVRRKVGSWQLTVDSQLPARASRFYCLLLTAYFSLNSCATYYQSNFEFNRQFESGNLKDAVQTLKKRAGQANGKDRFLYFV
ncbi:MAG: hypothetical protein ACKO96_23670, partial [Flammeovirgaceae bacterium]